MTDTITKEQATVDTVKLKPIESIKIDSKVFFDGCTKVLSGEKSGYNSSARYEPFIRIHAKNNTLYFHSAFIDTYEPKNRYSLINKYYKVKCEGVNGLDICLVEQDAKEFAIYFKKSREIIISINKNTYKADIESTELDIKMSINMEVRKHFPTTTYNDINRIKELNSVAKLRIPCNELLQIFTDTDYALSNDNLRPALQHLYTKFSKNGVNVVGTDGRRLSIQFINSKKYKHFKEQIEILHSKHSVRNIKTMLTKNKTKMVEVDIVKDGKTRYTMFTIDGVCLCSEIDTDERYPKHNNIIPPKEDMKLRFNVNRKTLIEKLILIEKTSCKGTYQIELEFTKDCIILTSEDIGYNRKSSTKCNYTIIQKNEDVCMKMGLNVKYLLQALQGTKNEYIEFNFYDKDHFCLINYTGGFALINPIIL